jgi:hypothetical protein
VSCNQLIFVHITALRVIDEITIQFSKTDRSSPPPERRAADSTHVRGRVNRMFRRISRFRPAQGASSPHRTRKILIGPAGVNPFDELFSKCIHTIDYVP